jgi:hypothetical protein
VAIVEDARTVSKADPVAIAFGDAVGTAEPCPSRGQDAADRRWSRK